MSRRSKGMGQADATAGKTTALIVMTMSSFLTPLALAAVNVALPSIGKEFSMDAISLGWVATAYLLSAAIFIVPAGRLADIHGRKKIFLLGLSIFTIGSFLVGIAMNPTTIILFRVIQGIGGSTLFGISVAILSSVFPPGERGRVLGIVTAAVYLGLSGGPFVGGILTHHLGWRSIFFLNVPFGVIMASSIMWKLKGEWAGARGEKFDLVGSCIYSLMLLGIMYGFSHLPSLSGFLLVAAGAAGVAAFVWWEGRTKSPVLDLGLFRSNRVFAFSNAATLVHYSATFTVSFLLSLYLQYIKGLSPQDAGFVLVSQPIVQAAFSPLAGRVSDRVEPRIVASTGMAITALGLFFLAVLTQADTPLPFIIMSQAVLGFGFAFFSSPNTNAIMGAVESRFYGVASSVVATMRVLGQMFSMGIAMLIFTILIGRVEIIPAYYPQLAKAVRVAFTLSGLLCVLGVFASLSRGKPFPASITSE
jgi:EmrB/QacA subfamily drug resistance transporter